MNTMFHVERIGKALFYKGFFLFFLFISFSCSTSRYVVDVSDYILVENGKEVLGRDKGLTAFIFENDPKRITFNQFLMDKYSLPKFYDIEYDITLENKRFNVMLYNQDEIDKYFDTSNYIASNVVPDNAVVGSKVKFLAISVTDDYGDDCLSEKSLYHNIVLKYLKDLKEEYYSL